MKTRIINIHPKFPEIDKIAYCAQIIRQGGLVVFPTETVYGIAADFLNPKALEQLRTIKKRPIDKPFSVMVSQKDAVEDMAQELDCSVYKLIDEFWPGPLTVILSTKEDSKTIGLRMPDHAIALSLVRKVECPVAAPSANFHNEEPPRTCQAALKDLDGLVDLAIDSGPTTVGKESSIVDLTQSPIRYLREGPISESEVRRIAQQKIVLFVCTGNSCRSAMAEYLLKEQLKERDDVKVISAGTGVFISMGASYDSIEVLKQEGIDASLHRSQPLTKIMLKKSDLILVMTAVHRQQVLERVHEVKNHVYLLKEFSGMSNESTTDLDIPDPIGKSPEAYEECLLVIKEAIRRVAEII